jgi:hypothetical protein
VLILTASRRPSFSRTSRTPPLIIAAIADLEAELKMKRDVRDCKYIALNEKRSKVGLGVDGSAAYGNDSPLYGAMGFVRKSDRASGLTRKAKPPTGTS